MIDAGDAAAASSTNTDARLPRTPGWRERVRQARDRLLADPRFQRWAAGFPPTRAIARRRARALFDLCAGFVYSQVLLACVELALFERLEAGPLRVEELARLSNLGVEPMTRLLEAASALRLLERRGEDRYGLGALGAALLGNPAVAAMIEHHRLLYADLAEPVDLLRGTRGETALGRYWPYARASAPASLTAAEVEGYSTLMATSQALVAQDILEAYPVDRHRRLLDVGGGEGAFLVAAARRAPSLELALFDLPSVAQRAGEHLREHGLGARAQVHGGDFRRDDLPGGADLLSLVRVVHDHDDGTVRALLERARRALVPGGTLLIAEPMAGTHGAMPVGAAYFGFYLLAMGSGRSRTPEQLSLLLRSTGFEAVEERATRRPLLCRVLVARAR